MRKLKLKLRREDTFDWRGAGDCSYHLMNGRGEEIQQFCASQFHSATGFSLKPGEEKRIEITIKAVK
jgi:hypothetical protein